MEVEQLVREVDVEDEDVLVEILPHQELVTHHNNANSQKDTCEVVVCFLGGFFLVREECSDVYDVMLYVAIVLSVTSNV